MDFEGYETILVVVMAIVATGVAIIYALGRSDESANVARDDAPSRADLSPTESPHVPTEHRSAVYGETGAARENGTEREDAIVHGVDVASQDPAQAASAPASDPAVDDIAAADETKAAGRMSPAPAPRARASSPSRSGSARRTAKPAPARAAAQLGERGIGGGAESDATESNPDPAGEGVEPVVETAPGIAPEPAATPQAPDDLTRIRGIGRGIAGKLNAMGVVSFAQMAAWTPDDLRRIDAALAFPGRAQRENWVGQAKALAAGKPGQGGDPAGGL